MQNFIILSRKPERQEYLTHSRAICPTYKLAFKSVLQPLSLVSSEYKSNHASSDLSKEGMFTCSKCMLPVHPLDVATKLGREGRLHMHQMGHDVPDYERHMQDGHALPGASRGTPNVTNKKEKKFEIHKVKNAVGAYKNGQEVSDDYSDSSSDEEEYKKPRTWKKAWKKAQKAHERRHNVDSGDFSSVPKVYRM